MPESILIWLGVYLFSFFILEEIFWNGWAFIVAAASDFLLIAVLGSLSKFSRLEKYMVIAACISLLSHPVGWGLYHYHVSMNVYSVLTWCPLIAVLYALLTTRSGARRNQNNPAINIANFISNIRNLLQSVYFTRAS